MDAPIKIPPRDAVAELRRRLDHVERAVELTVSWQYQLRSRVDEVRDSTKADRLAPLEALVTQLEQEVELLRHVLQDVSQLLVRKGLLGAEEPLRAPPPPPVLPAAPKAARAVAAVAPPPAAAAPSRAPRALTRAQWAADVARAREIVGIKVLADGYADGSPVGIEVRFVGESDPFHRISAAVKDGEIHAEWEVPEMGPANVEVDFVARIAGEATLGGRLIVEQGEGRRRARGRRNTDHPLATPPAPEAGEPPAAAAPALTPVPAAPAAPPAPAASVAAAAPPAPAPGVPAPAPAPPAPPAPPPAPAPGVPSPAPAPAAAALEAAPPRPARAMPPPPAPPPTTLPAPLPEETHTTTEYSRDAILAAVAALPAPDAPAAAAPPLPALPEETSSTTEYTRDAILAAIRKMEAEQAAAGAPLDDDDGDTPSEGVPPLAETAVEELDRRVVPEDPDEESVPDEAGTKFFRPGVADTRDVREDPDEESLPDEAGTKLFKPPAPKKKPRRGDKK